MVKKRIILSYLKICGFNVPKFDVISISDDFNNYKPSFEADLFSVRSSCSLEDSDDKSFAGQFETYLNVTRQDLIDKIKDCFESMSNKKISDKFGITDFERYVIVQEMILSNISGVLFTSNPQGLLNETVITCGKGLGEGIVSGGAETTTYYYNQTDDVYYYDGNEELISGKMVRELVMLSNDIKKNLGEFLDIEFAIKDNIVYVLQARKITTLDGNNLLVLDNSNISESFPGVSLPITISVAHLIYSGVFKSAISRVLKNDEETARLENVFNNMVGDCNGRLYYKISNWYEIILRLPFSSKIIPIWQDMLGVRDKKIVANAKYSKRKNLKVYYNFLHEIKNVPKSMAELDSYFEKVYKEYKVINIKEISYEELVKLFKTISDKLFAKWDITLFNDMYTFIYTGMLKKRLKKKYTDYEKIVNSIISGNKSLASLEAIRNLIRLATSKNELSDEEYKDAFNDYIEQYGDRTVGELKIETQTYRVCPKLLEEKIRNYEEQKDKLKQTITDSDNNEINITSFDKRTKKLIEKCKLGIQNREKSRLNRSRIFGMCREMILQFGTILEAEDKITDKNDVFYLTINELLNQYDNNFKKVVDERKDKYTLFYKLPAYSRLIFSGNEFNKSNVTINSETLYNDKETLRGVPCSGGVCEGEVIVMDESNTNIDTKGKIVVSKMTDPGFAFLMDGAKGVISERGSILSHTAIIARELKIPLIVGVKDLLISIKTGDIVHMDANTGIINIIR